MPLRAVIFDFDGVIVDSEPLHFDAFRAVLAEEGIDLTKDLYESRYLAMDDKTCFAAAFADAGRALSHPALDDLIERKARRLEADLAAGPLFPGVPDFIRMLAERVPLAINSGALRAEIELVLAGTGLADCFRTIVSAEDVTRCKPDPEGYRLALDRLTALPGVPADIAPPQCLVVEDSVHGIASARAAGMACLAVTNSYPADFLGDASHVVASLDGLAWDVVARIVA